MEQVNINKIFNQNKTKKTCSRIWIFVIRKKIWDKCGTKLMDTEIKTGIDAAKTASKRFVQENAEATGRFIRNKIADKITSAGKLKNKEN